MSDHTSMESIVVRLAGDSGDGVQLMGSQFIASTALSGKDFATFPDFPAEIRAPVGTTFGVSAYQMNLGASRITTAGGYTGCPRCIQSGGIKSQFAITRGWRVDHRQQ